MERFHIVLVSVRLFIPSTEMKWHYSTSLIIHELKIFYFFFVFQAYYNRSTFKKVIGPGWKRKNALFFSKSKKILDLSKMLRSRLNHFGPKYPDRFGLDQKRLFITEYNIWNHVQNICFCPKWFGQVKNIFGLLEGQGKNHICQT